MTGDSSPAGYTRLKGDASSRAYFRGEGHILVQYPADSMASFDNFLFWHQRYRDAGLTVPGVIEVDRTSQSMILEDWGDQHGVDYLVSQCDRESRLAVVREVVSWIPRIAKMADGNSEYRSAPVPLADELTFMITHAGDTIFNGADMEPVDRLCALVLEQTGNLSQRLAHRDLHFRNILVKEGGLCLIDFQDTRLAPDGYDLSSLLFDNYVDLSAERPAFAAQLDQPGFRWTALQRSLKALGTFCYFGLKLGKQWFVPAIPIALGHVQNHLTALNLRSEQDEWQLLRKQAEKIIPAGD